MELTPCKSSHIAGAEYLSGDRVMLIRYHDGALYARLDVAPGQYVGFMAAASKGKFVNAMLNRAILISKRKEGAEIEEVTERGAAEGQAAAPLNVLDGEADPCCRQKIKQAFASWGVGSIRFGSAWECPACGTCFMPEMVGPVRNWRIQLSVAVVRR